MNMRPIFALAMAGLILSAAAFSYAADAPTLKNDRYEIVVQPDSSLQITVVDGACAIFAPKFLVLRATFDPKPALRWGRLGDPRLEKMYNVMEWQAKPSVTTSPVVKPKKAGHVEDGYDPSIDRAGESGRTGNVFAAAPGMAVSAKSASVAGNSIDWVFSDQEDFVLRAKVTLLPGAAQPVLAFQFQPKSAAWYSVAYVGAPAASADAVDEIWQPLIWQERRFPNEAYLTEAARCPLPATLVTSGGVTTGVVVDPAELPFQPLPTVANSRFGVAVRNGAGQMQSTVFAPILGGLGSKMSPGDSLSFSVRLLVQKARCVDAYQLIAREIYGFCDYRCNTDCNLNTTLENTIDYAMSPFAHFNEELRGNAYDTDVPGAVKNISPLHPLGAALVTDDERLYSQRAKPMIEYAMSREKFLFASNPAIKGQFASSKLDGPGVPLVELTGLYEMSHKRSGVFLEDAKSLVGRTRVLNLDAELRGDTWQNALALYRATGEKNYLDRAIAGADDYIARRIEKEQLDYSDPDSRGMFFWTSFAPQWAELYELYEQTGEKRFLAAAQAGAREFAQFVYLCPVIPDGQVVVNEGGKAPRYRTSDKFKTILLPEERVDAWRVSEIGLTSESSGTSKGHRGIFLASYAPWMLRLSMHCDDPFLHDIGRSAVVGRYAGFPGYHMNTARTTAYEKPDFAKRNLDELNSMTSLHYNHIWGQIAMLIDYLISDVYSRSAGRIDFPSHYSEGYAYVQSKIYGDRPGHFYEDDNLWLWMPKGLLRIDSPQLNYISARGTKGLYVALSNQSNKPVTATLRLNRELLSFDSAAAFPVRQWIQNAPGQPLQLQDGVIQVTVPAAGLTALAFDGVRIMPRFQPKFDAPQGDGWRQDSARLNLGGARGMILSMSPQLTNAYVYLQANGQQYKHVILHYSIDGAAENTMDDGSYPFEYSLPLGPQAHRFEFSVECIAADGTSQRSGSAVLYR